MKQFVSALVILTLSIALNFKLYASPAYPNLIVFTQPDKTTKLTIYLHGDERVHWAETVDGYSLLYNSEGYLCYAEPDGQGGMQPSSFVATTQTERSSIVQDFLSTIPTNLRFSRSQIDEYLSFWNTLEFTTPPTKEGNLVGERRALVILFQTADCQFSHRKSEFVMLFNQEHYTTDNATGSVYDYYYAASNGQFSLHVDVIGPITGDYEMSYYGSESSPGYSTFATEVVSKAEGMTDFSQYDNNGDGVVDGVHIIFAGHGEEAGGGEGAIWSHQWYVWNSPTFDGVTFGPYSCSPECRGNMGNYITNIGVICHELGHVFGAPDYYDTDYSGSDGEYYGLGKWDIMSSGSWNNNGRTPARHGAYTASVIYGWTTPVLLDDPQQVRIEQANNRHDVYRINTSTPGDYFLLENRQRKSFDQSLPAHGMLVYHVHSGANGPSVENYRHPQQLYIMPAYCATDHPDAAPSSYCNPDTYGTPFPSQLNYDSLTDYSTPWLRPWSGALNGTPLYHIQENPADSSIHFFFKQTSSIEPIRLAAHYVSEFEAHVEWQVYGTYPALVLMSNTPNFVTPDTLYNTGDTLDNGNIVLYMGNEISHTLVAIDSSETPDTLYFKLFTSLTDSTYSEGITAMAIPYEYIPVSIYQTASDPKFTIYPNPARSQVVIETDVDEMLSLNYTMSDIMGRTVYVGTISQGRTILNTSALPRGTYFITLYSANGRSVKKVAIW